MAPNILGRFINTPWNDDPPPSPWEACHLSTDTSKHFGGEGVLDSVVLQCYSNDHSFDLLGCPSFEVCTPGPADERSVKVSIC